MRVRLVRLGMAGLALLIGWWGGWARLYPRHFFDHFPGLGHHWTAAYPPYNVHLITDLGATFLTLAALLVLGALSRQRAVRTVALLGVVIFNVLHLSFHATAQGEMPMGDYGASIVSLVAGVLAPVALLLLDRSRPVLASGDQPPALSTRVRSGSVESATDVNP